MQTPIYTPDEARTRETFLALMWSLSYPGRSYQLPEDDPFQAVAETLLDLETSFFTSDTDLNHALARTGARALDAASAAYHFYPALTALETVQAASVGTMLYPDKAATLVIGCQLNTGKILTLTGPGIPTSSTIQVGGLPDEFWQVRQQRSRYPLGWDVFLIDGHQVTGIPRSTQIEGA